MKILQWYKLSCLQRFLPLVLFSGSFALHFPLTAGTADTLRKRFSSRDTLAEVQVRGIRPALSHTSLTPVQTLSGQKLERMNTLTLTDALRYFSGLQVKDYGGIGGLKTVNIRSLGSQHTAVFYDGIQLGNAQNGETDLGRFSLENLEEISLYIAQRSNIFQPARAFAAASSLYLQSTTPLFKQNEADHLTATVKTGSFGLFNPALTWQHKLSKNSSSSLSVEWQKADGRYKFRYTNSVYDTTAVRQNGDTEALRLEGGLNGTLRDSSTWRLKAFHYFNKRGLPRAIVSNNFESLDRQWDRNTFIQSSWQSAANSKYELMVHAKYARDYTRYLQPAFDNINGSLDNRYRQQEYYLSAAGQYHVHPLADAALAADLLINSMSSDIQRFSYPVRYTKLMAASVQLHTERVKIQGSLLATLVNETVKENSAAADKRKLSPAISASWQPFRQNTVLLRAFYKDIFRMPTFNDLYYTYAGNTTLRPEYTKQIDAGITLQKAFSSNFWQSVSFQADAWRNRVKDKIVAIPGENIATWMMMNLGKADIKGLETNLAARVLIDKDVTINAALNYTYQRALDVTNPADFNYRHQIPYTPENTGSFILGTAYKGLWINYSYIYTGERYSQKANIAENYMEPWYTHDLTASTTLRSGKASYKITGEVNNLLNQYRDVVLNFPMPGRSYRVSLSMNY